MPSKKKPATSKPRELDFKDINYQIAYHPRGVKTSDDIKPCTDIIGQDRAIEALKTGLHVHSRGYNVFVTGPAGTGRTTTISHILQGMDLEAPNLVDFCYVNNFKNVDNPRVLSFKAGDGRRFKKDMEYLVSSLRKVVPKVFMSEDYKDRHSRISREFENRQKDLIHKFEDKLAEAGFAMVQIQSGMGVRNEIQPLIEGEPTSLEKLEHLAREDKFPMTQLDELRRRWDSLRREFDVTTVESKKLSSKHDDAIEKLNLSMIAPLITDKINLLKKRYPGEKTILYLDEAEEALISDIDRFREARPRRGEEEAPAYRKREPFEEFSVNLILDNSETTSVPIVIEKSPSYVKLFGSLERVVDRFGYWRTDFTRISAGSLLRAVGGFLVVNAIDLLMEPGVWVQLKRTLLNRELEITGFDQFSMFAGAGIKPEPIPLDIKVVLKGDQRIYNLLWNLDEDFKKIFKVKAEFNDVMKADKRGYNSVFEFVRRVIDEDGLLPLDLSGLQAVAEYATQIAGRRNKLTVRFTLIADIVRESAFCAQQRRSRRVERRDVHCAIRLRRSRSSLIEDRIQELYDNQTLMVSTSGKAVGQINGLAVFGGGGDFTFGRPVRITAATSLGRAGVINIEREADLSGPTHTKGILVLTGYLRTMFAQNKPLIMSASISFEQSYSGVDGDSASSTEIYAILSSLSGIPIKQSYAVTGSVNQKGQIQPIGGVNEKIEGFFDVCRHKRLTGHQGVLIPQQNVDELLLRPDIIDAVKEGKFHIYPIRTVEEGIAILTGIPAGKKRANGSFTPDSVFAKVDEKLEQMAHDFSNFGRDNDSKNRLLNSRAGKSGKKK